MKTKTSITFLLLLAGCLIATGQELLDSISPAPVVVVDTLTSLTDTVPAFNTDTFSVFNNRPPAFNSDSLGGFNSLGGFGQDSAAVIDLSQIKVAADGLDAPVDYTATDSMIYDIAEEKIYLFGNATVKYEEISLTAGFIVLDWKENIVTAEGLEVGGAMVGNPQFKDGDQEFTAQKMRYNFETEKGIVYDISTTQNGMFVKGSRSKFVRTQEDTIVTDIVYSQDAIFTTCNLDHPHYGIRSSKQKIIPNKLIVVGPSNLEIMGIPTPLWLPFGFFPIPGAKRKQGLLFPRDYEYSDEWGFGLRNIGYYLPINDYFDLTVLGDIYVKGTWGLNVSTNFAKRYKYNGRVGIGYTSRRTESSMGEISFSPSFSIQTSINQDSRAHPAIRFGGNVNIQANNYQSVNQNDAQSVLQNQLSSNLTFSHTFPGQPFSLSSSLSHSQNTRTREVSISFPTLNFQTQTIQPFKRKKRVGEEKWYERISMDYKGEFRNRFTTTDTTLFTQQTLDNAQMGARHRIGSNASFKILKYFNITPSASYEETWHFKSIEKTFDDMPTIEADTIYNADSTDFEIVLDTLAYGTVNIDTLRGFEAARQFTTSLSLNTQIFGTLLFKKGPIRGLRHVVKPNISFNYTPDYTDPSRGYFKTVQTDFRTPEEVEEYSIFQGNIYNGPPSGGRQMSVSYSLNNIFEAKYFSKKDSTDKKLKLFDNIYVRGNYNFARDSLKWSMVNMSGTTRLFKGISTLSFQATFDPYSEIINENGRAVRVDQFYIKETGKLLRFEKANMRIGTNITVAKLRELLQGKEEEIQLGAGAAQNDLEDDRQSGRTTVADVDPNEPEDILSLFENFSISHNLVLSYEQIDGQDTFRLSTNTLALRGNIDLTDKWRVRVGNFGYDFTQKRVTYPDFGISRNLHCWQLSFNWQPVRNTYSLTIQVNPGSPLDFLKIPYARNNQDGRGFEGF